MSKKTGKKRGGTMFAERNPLWIAGIGLTAMVVAFFTAFNAEALPVVGAGPKYTAEFAESGGLREGNEVRIAGVRVGHVTDIRIDGHTVEVDFRVDEDLGDQTTAAVKVKTMLGQKYLALEPAGRGPMSRGDVIPVARTTTPYDVTAAFQDLSRTMGEIDTEQMEESLDTLADTFRDTPESMQEMLDGLTDLSRTVSTRDEELAELMEGAADVTEVLAVRSEDLASLLTEGSLILGELERRREAVGNLLTGTERLGRELQGLVEDNEATLAPALAELDEVARVLQRNQDNLNAAVRAIGPYYRTVVSAMGSGHWIDSYICGLFDENGVPLLENDVERNCEPVPGGGR